MKFLTSFAAVFVPLILIDFVWLGFIARTFYAQNLSSIIAPTFSIGPSLVFYPLYAFALTILIVTPLLAGASWTEALWRGALFGLAAYGVYDLSNQATIPTWPSLVTVVDMAWGAALTGSVSAIAFWLLSFAR